MNIPGHIGIQIPYFASNWIGQILDIHSWFTINTMSPSISPSPGFHTIPCGCFSSARPWWFQPNWFNIVYAAVSPSWDTMRVPSEDSKIGKWVAWFEHLSKVTMSGFHISARIGKAWKSAWNLHENLPETMIDTISGALQLYLLKRVEQCKSKIHLT